MCIDVQHAPTDSTPTITTCTELQPAAAGRVCRRLQPAAAVAICTEGQPAVAVTPCTELQRACGCHLELQLVA